MWTWGCFYRRFEKVWCQGLKMMNLTDDDNFYHFDFENNLIELVEVEEFFQGAHEEFYANIED